MSGVAAIEYVEESSRRIGYEATLVIRGTAIQDSIVLGTRISGALGQILFDRAEESFGRALPRTPEQVADPEVINALCRQYAPMGESPLPTVQSAWLPGVEFFVENQHTHSFLFQFLLLCQFPDLR